MGTNKNKPLTSGRGFFKDLDMPWMKRPRMRWSVPYRRSNGLEPWRAQPRQLVVAVWRCADLYELGKFHWHPNCCGFKTWLNFVMEIFVGGYSTKNGWEMLGDYLKFVQIYAFSASACRIWVVQSKSCCLHLRAAGFFLRPNYWGSLTQVMAW